MPTMYVLRTLPTSITIALPLQTTSPYQSHYALALETKPCSVHSPAQPVQPIHLLQSFFDDHNPLSSPAHKINVRPAQPRVYYSCKLAAMPAANKAVSTKRRTNTTGSVTICFQTHARGHTLQITISTDSSARCLLPHVLAHRKPTAASPASPSCFPSRARNRGCG